MNLKPFLTPPQTIAIVGLSDKPERPSYGVASYLISHDFTVIPVNPTVATVFGSISYPSLSAIPKEIKIDIVDIFRQPAEVLPIVKEVLELGIKPLIWMQEGVIAPEAKALAESEGLIVVMNKCMMKEHRSL